MKIKDGYNSQEMEKLYKEYDRLRLARMGNKHSLETRLNKNRDERMIELVKILNLDTANRLYMAKSKIKENL